MNIKDEALAVLNAAGRCEEHPINLTVNDIRESLYGRQWCTCEEEGGEPCHSYCDTGGAAVFLLKDGQFATVTEWSDTSGHG